jgi:hypothetical protein
VSFKCFFITIFFQYAKAITSFNLVSVFLLCDGGLGSAVFFAVGCGASRQPNGAEQAEPYQKPKAPKLGRYASMTEEDSNVTLGVIDTTSTIKLGADGNPVMDNAQVYQKPEAVREIIRTALKRNFIFQTMEPSSLERLIDVFRPVHCKVGENIIEQGTTGEYM